MGTDRRIGIVLIAVAALALMVVSRVNGRDVPGEAVALPWTPPPAVGACLKFSDAGADDTGMATLDPKGTDRTPADPAASAFAANDPQAVPCSRPHQVEVTQSWRKDAQPDGRTECDNMGATRTTRDSADWQAPQLWLMGSYVHGGDPLGWVACVQGPVTMGRQMTSLLYTGRLLHDSGRAGPTVGACFRDGDQQVDCAVPHFLERVGEFRPQYLSRKPATSCEAFARSVVGAKAFQGPNPLRTFTSQDPSIGVTMLDGDAQRMIPMTTCNVMSAEPGRELSDSVVGLGDKPIPYS